MWRLNKNLYLFSFCILWFYFSSMGCLGREKKIEYVRSEIKKTNILSSDIQEKIDQEKYQEAFDMSETYLKDYPLVPQTQNVEFLRSRALEGLGKFEEAIESYRKIVRTSASSRDIAARSLYRLSFCYESTGQDDKLVASLLDVLSRKKDLEVEVITAEVPARIASAYARLGNKKLADKYFGIADSGIRSLKAKNAGVSLERWLPKTLFFMGTMSVGTFRRDDFETSLRPLEKSQSFLLEAALIGDPKWSPRAVEELKAIYTGILELIQKTNLATNENEEKIEQEARWKMAASTLELLKKLKLESYSLKTPPPSEMEEVSSFINSKEIELARILDEKPIGAGLTPEAAKRKQKQLKMRVVNPDPMLEEISRGKK
ncbi:MAG: hypothetical protein A4S09_01660 [Proteobacteria bacterium SG_bin7]|nr:MAG: hypothetical protein A4S09_01660 [Proteobacteria bacterium SG_bin7]